MNRLLLALIVAGCIVTPSIGQGQPVQPPNERAADVAGPYLLAAEDALSISVINFPNLSTQVVIPPDGTITVPLLEPLNVTGKTTGEVAQILTAKWKRYVVNPSVSVSLTQRRKESIVFYGSWMKPGPLEYRANLRIVEAMAQIGGPLANGDLSRVSVTHRSGIKQTLDLSHPESKGGTAVDLPLAVGDIVFVPERRTQVTILGEVNTPGPIDYKEGMTVLDALKSAGGARLETADLSSATLAHAGKSAPLNLDTLLRKGDLAANLVLEAGDSITVPEIRNRTYVFGSVLRAGFYNFRPGDRLLDALTGVGGPTQQADLSKVHVIHIKSDKTVNGVEQVDLNKFLRDKKADLKYNVALGAGDVVFIPERKKGFSLTDLFQVLTGVSLLRVIAP